MWRCREDDRLLTVPMPIAMAGVEALDRERSCTVDETDRPSRGGNIPSSSDVSSLSSGDGPCPLIGSTDDG